MAEEKFFKVALELVNDAGKLVRHAFTQPSSSISFKSSATDFVTATDKAVEELLIGGLSAQFPNHKYIGEESTSSEKRLEFTDQPTWIIDPIDGTTNFVHRIPLIAISVGLAINKKLQAGIIYNPITNELYTAQSGRGAFKNGFPIYASKVEAVNKAVVSTSCNCVGIPVADKHKDWLETGLWNLKKTTLAGVHGHSSLGSAAVIMGRVAEGCIDAYVEYGLRCWDMAAGAVIVREAGGFVTSPLEFTFLRKYGYFSERLNCSGAFGCVCKGTYDFSSMLFQAYRFRTSFVAIVFSSFLPMQLLMIVTYAAYFSLLFFLGVLQGDSIFPVYRILLYFVSLLFEEFGDEYSAMSYWSSRFALSYRRCSIAFSSIHDIRAKLNFK